MKPLVSIYLPTHNRRVILDRAVRSVLGQTYPHIELIVVNDGSSDETKDYLDQKQAEDPRLIPINLEQSGGPSAARNLAIKKARGMFVTGLDDDDEFTEDRIKTFLENWAYRTEGNISCLFTQSTFVTKNKRWETEDKKDYVRFEDLFHHNYIGNQVFTKKEYLIDAGLFDERLDAWEDLEFFIRLTQKFGEARLLNVSTYVCDVSTDRDRISRNEPRIRRAVDFILKKYPDLTPHLKQRLFLQMFSDYHGIHPSFSDFKRFFTWGLDIKGTIELVKPVVKSNIKLIMGR